MYGRDDKKLSYRKTQCGRVPPVLSAPTHRRTLRALCCAAIAWMLLAFAPTVPGAAERFRWGVKTATDPLAGEIHRRAEATVTELCEFPRPYRVGTQTPRLAPFEQTIYTVQARFLFYRAEEDGDIHLVLQDPADESQTIVAEIPDPAGLVQLSPFAAEIAKLRRAFERRWPPTSSRRNGEQILVSVTGIGFFDSRHDVLGAAPNGFELHPLLELKVLGP